MRKISLSRHQYIVLIFSILLTGFLTYDLNDNNTFMVEGGLIIAVIVLLAANLLKDFIPHGRLKYFILDCMWLAMVAAGCCSIGLCMLVWWGYGFQGTELPIIFWIIVIMIVALMITTATEMLTRINTDN